MFAVHVGVLHHGHGAAIDYVGVALAALASWAGIPGPGEPVLIAASVVAAKNKLDITPVLIAAWVGATAGGIIGWLVGLKAGRWLVMAKGPLHTLRLRTLKRTEGVFRRMEVVAIVMAPSWVAGIHRSRARVYLVVNALSAALLWTLPIGLGAYYAGPPILEAVKDFGIIGTAVVVAAVIVAAAIEVLRRARRGRERSA